MIYLYLVGAGVFGMLMGYFFGWSVKEVQPNANEVSILLSTVLGGTVLSLLNLFNTAAALPIYIIGVAVGLVIYFVLLKFNWPSVSSAMATGSISRPPVLPRKMQIGRKTSV